MLLDGKQHRQKKRFQKRGVQNSRGHRVSGPRGGLIVDLTEQMREERDNHGAKIEPQNGGAGPGHKNVEFRDGK